MHMKVAELLKHDEAVAVPLGKVTGRDPAMLSGMLANVEMLVQQSLEMNRVTVSVCVPPPKKEAFG